VKKLVKATGVENYNVLQNNGRIAHQEVDHVSLSGVYEDIVKMMLIGHVNRFTSTW
jgi:hypothetical protein